MSAFKHHSSSNQSSHNIFSVLKDSDYDSDSDSKEARKTFKFIDSKLEKNQRSKNKKTTSNNPTTPSHPISHIKPNMVISFSNENFPSLPKQKIVSITVSKNWNNISEDVKFPPLPLKKQSSMEVSPEKTVSRIQYCIEKALEKKYIYTKSILHNWADDEYWNSEDEFEKYNEADFYCQDEDPAIF